MELKGIAPSRALLLATLASANATKVPEHLGEAVYLFDKARALGAGALAGRACLHIMPR